MVKSNMVTTSANRYVRCNHGQGKIKPTKPSVSGGRENRFRRKGCQSSKKEKEQENSRDKCSSNCRGRGLFDDKVICDILCNLPVRSLIQFKCVCKPWQLFIEKDPHFLGLHLAHSKKHPKFFVVIERTIGRALLVAADYLCSEEGSGTAALDVHHNIREIEVPFESPAYFGPLHGLVGFYDCYSYNGIRLSNVCTQETNPWITSTFVTNFKLERDISVIFANCRLGFDPDTKRHKVVCIGRIFYHHFRPPCVMFCEVLTVGDREWRIVEGGVPSNLVRSFALIWNSFYLNGSIYYNTFGFMKSGDRDKDTIVAFDVASEKFRAITIPDFIVNHPRDIDVAIDNPVNLLEMDGRLAISCRINCRVVKIWLYDDDDDDFRSKYSWREITIELPFVWDRDRKLTFLSGAPKNEIIIKSAQDLDRGRKRGKICSLSYHSYNWKKKTFMDIKINGIPSAFGRLVNSLHSDAIFTESLFPVP